MSLVRLRTFIEVYRQRSISGAARMLNLTQPAVSQHIAGLEMTIGRPLFARQASGVVPTSAADELAADIGDKLDAVEAALASARARSRNVPGALQLIGHADFMAEKLAPQLAPLLEAGIRLRMHTGDGPLVTQMLLEGHCDLGISAHPVTDNRLRSETILTDKVVAVAAPAVVERLTKAADFAKALLQEPLLAYNLELSLVDDWLEHNRLLTPELLPAMVGQDLRAHRSLLVQGVGWSVMPKFLCQKQLKRGELKLISPPRSHTDINYYLIWLPSALRQPRVAHAKQMLLARVQ
ncbi:LysR family transcriptional regulator [Celerinatantimonas diazotrophica]|uniref:DNA-binding transcriptional LysR family regulator n=1 Tax=Celerinatantimonas diazotrophica TaxID=412034 RepID=A0A4R1K3B5_9GAMM|nr:LysR family transcriptional regulator [Celerinatantimonas diazotrophica]TCK58578.1 DNA-binding transcriptional LysR family regulator [Celerinatantimonas diazotrophica]CAG9297207.1 HTH-type transcriptional regulator ArgP [Celerinatantimonas diazotrophica]